MPVMTELERVQADYAARRKTEHDAYEAKRAAEIAAIRKATGLPVGTGWRSWDDPAGTPNDPEAKAALPKAARELAETAEAAGWRWVCSWSLSSSDAPYVNLVAAGRPGRCAVDACWHTHDSPSGRPRLFSVLVRGDGGGWHDASLKAARVLVTSNPCVPQADSAV